MAAVVGARVTDGCERVDFGVLSVAFDGRVLHPRPWTVIQATWAAELAADVPAGPILELCCGAGHIGLLAALLSGRRVVQVDSDPSACRFARLNAEAAALAADVEIRCADLGSALRPDERFPIIIADPPYIPSGELGRFPADPRAAIDGGQDGLDAVRACLDVVSGHLLELGACLLQVRGPAQLEALAPLVERRSLVVRAARVVDDERAVALVGRGDNP